MGFDYIGNRLFYRLFYRPGQFSWPASETFLLGNYPCANVACTRYRYQFTNCYAGCISSDICLIALPLTLSTRSGIFSRKDEAASVNSNLGTGE